MNILLRFFQLFIIVWYMGATVSFSLKIGFSLIISLLAIEMVIVLSDEDDVDKFF